MQETLLLDIFFYFCATVICVPFFKSLGLGSIFGYLFSGLILGRHGLALLHHADNIHEISEIGLIMLLFVIGLELSPARLNKLKKIIVGVGLLQFSLTTTIFYFALSPIGLSSAASFLIASALSLSSTAFSLTYLQSSQQLTKSYGQSSFGILIFQDLIVIPLMTAIPFLANYSESSFQMNTQSFLINMGIVIASMIVSKFALRPILNKIFYSQSKEIFIGSCLIIVLGGALLMEYIGLSKALGAFLAGLFLSGSGFRSEIQSFSVPLKSMLMGVFFMGFGLEFDLLFFQSHFKTIFALSGSFIIVKFSILFLIGLAFHKDWKTSIRLGLLLCQGGEFGFWIIGQCLSHNIVTGEIANYTLSAITVSIFAAPFLTKLLDYIPTGNPEVAVEQEAEIYPLPTSPIENKEAA
ncbi:MAG: hypothetical protein HN509_02055 [Halobacteriovoraceae bacterium]|nr:hypothetical protein [Halobacteriovoraceae bacterium]